MTPEIIFTLVTIVVMFVLMLTEIIPLPATMALTGIALMFGGIVTPSSVYSNFGGSTIIFLIVMSLIVDALTETGIIQNLSDLVFRGKILVNQRFAIFVTCMFSGIATGFLSNTALVVMLIPVLAALVLKSNGNLRLKYLLLGVATEATVGGSISLIGGAPNLATQGALEEAGVETMGFFSAAPLSIILVIVTAIYFATLGYNIMRKVCNFDDTEITKNAAPTNRVSAPTWKKVVSLAVLVGCIICFILDIGDNQIIGFIGVAILWITRCTKPGPALKAVDWNTMWVLNFALVVAAAVIQSGTAAYVADFILVLCGGENASYVLVLLVVLAIGGVLTQVMSNTATNAMFTPICISLAASLGVSPLAIAIPSMLMVNCAVTSPLGSPCMTVALNGGYRPKDYLLVGLPLLIILIPFNIFGSLIIYGV